MKEIALFGGMALLVISTIYNRHQQEKALALLSNEERGSFVAQFSKLRILNLYTLIAMFVLYFGFTTLLPQVLDPAITYFSLIFVYMSATHFLAQRKMNQIELPKAYKEMHRKTSIIRWVSMIIMFAGLIYYLYA
jgi:uncharacterized membrane protein (DUF485 family)